MYTWNTITEAQIISESNFLFRMHQHNHSHSTPGVVCSAASDQLLSLLLVISLTDLVSVSLAFAVLSHAKTKQTITAINTKSN
jgi:hypothetical protein